MIPTSVEDLSKRSQAIINQVKNIVQNEIIPIETELCEWHDNTQTKWIPHPRVTDLREQAKARGLWNLYLTSENEIGKRWGAGLRYVEYVYVAEQLGWSVFASEIFNCRPPQNGNLAQFATPQQFKKWFAPILNGTSKSAFAMTEKEVASSDPTNIRTTVIKEGNNYIINGQKWLVTGGLHPRTTFCFVVGKSPSSTKEAKDSRHSQHTMMMVPMNSPGLTVVNHHTLFGFDNAPYGFAAISLKNVCVPCENRLMEEGEAFKLTQGSFSTARFYLCCELIGMAERALDVMIRRAKERKAFGVKLAENSNIQLDISLSRTEIDQSRLLILKTGHIMDTKGPKEARLLISQIKSTVPQTVCKIIDRAIQVCGGLGFCQDSPLARMYAVARGYCIQDGPDSVHHMVVSRLELKGKM